MSDNSRVESGFRAGLPTGTPDDGNRRLANQAFYTRLEVAENEELRPVLAEPFAATTAAARGNTPHPAILVFHVRKHLGGPRGTRTRNLRIKSPQLYH